MSVGDHCQYQLGVMQGRLLPKYKGRYQAHPVGYWQEEFPLARSLGLDLIEFILDFNDAEQNPLMSDAGCESLQATIRQTGIGIKSICADYFMEAPLHHLDAKVAAESLRVLRALIQRAPGLKVTDIVIPCVDQSTLSDAAAVDRFVTVMQDVMPEAEGCGVNLALETDLPPKPFASLIERLGSRAVTVNYDTGNSASLGFDPGEELAAYGDVITDIHIKDRKLGGGSVVLGSGDCDFERFFAALSSLDFKGHFIMQAYRDDEGVEIFKKQLAWIRPFLQRWDETRRALS